MITALSPDTRLNEEEAADYLGIAPNTLRGYRAKGTGPKYTRVGRSPQYRVKWLEEYLEKQTQEPII